MRYLPTGKQMQEADRHTIEKIGIPSLVLMERAALATLQVLEEEKPEIRNVLIVCGSGNNGGDGFVLARLLSEKKVPVTVVFAGNLKSRTPECKTQMKLLEKLGVPVCREIPEESFSVVVDALFGVGLSRPVEGTYLEVLRKMNAMDGYKVAIDIPSGIDSSTGQILGSAFQADLTVSMQCEKRGTVLFPGKTLAGKVRAVPIGIDVSELQKDHTVSVAYEPSDLAAELPKRQEDSHKGNFGKVLVIAGSPGMSGAAYFCASAAYAVGAGLVKIYTPQENALVLQQLLPEALLTAYTEFDEKEAIAQLDWADVVLVGPGLAKSTTAAKLLETVLKHAEIPCVIDADGLNLLSEEGRLELLKNRDGEVVVTPHMKEMQRLLHLEHMAELKTQRFELSAAFAETYGAVCVLKDSRTVVQKTGRHPFVNTSGNNAMAKGGSGDVLAGTIAGLLAQKMPTYEAACLSVYLHGTAGDRLRERKGEYGVMARELVKELQYCGRMGE